MTLEDAINLIRSYQLKAPVQVVPIAEVFELEVYRANGWPDDISGMIKRGKSGKYQIYVNAKHHVNRRRFTIAHEIAHFICHKDFIGDGIVDDALYRSKLSNRLEAEANRFAADILMPWHLLVPSINEGNDDIEVLAEMFGVSKSAMSIRLGVPYETEENL